MWGVSFSKRQVASSDVMVIRGAREHNLKNLSVDIPRGQFVVVTGVSGSGKSTLAFDLVFAEGQRRFLDAMNAYARQFVDQLARPDVDLVAGLPPTVSIEQRNSRGGGKSTVATVTEVHHFFRLLFARLGVQFCPECRVPVVPQSLDAVVGQVMDVVRGRGECRLLAPMIKNRKGHHSEVAEWAKRQGYSELRADGELREVGEPFRLDRYREHNVEVVVARWAGGKRVDAEDVRREVERALEVGEGMLLLMGGNGGVTLHSTLRACGGCGRSFEPLDPKHFSYNSSVGWCGRCRGFGELFYLPDVERGARADAIEESWYGWQEGEREVCPECMGMRLNPVARSVRLVGEGRFYGEEGVTMDTLSRWSVAEAAEYFAGLKFSGVAEEVSRDILPEIRERLRFLGEVGLGYLQLGRGVPTLSGGEAQRIRLAAQLGSNLSGVLYVLDEPTIGLHARDNEQLLNALEMLRGRGNSLLVVEHDEATMRRADHVIDLGPGAGVEGGEVVAAGTLAQLKRNRHSLTGRCLSELQGYPARGERREVGGGVGWLELEGAGRNNLRDVRLRLPLGRFSVVTGVSGSGKSTLMRECLLPVLTAALKGLRLKGEEGSGRGSLVSGGKELGAVYEVDQAPIGRTPRSVPATYVGFFDDIRALYAQVPEARLRGYGAGRFSFNSAQGRCEGCEGAGEVKLEMNFLPPAFTRCEACGGRRFKPETLDVEMGGKSIAGVLDMSVKEALKFFEAHPRIRRPLEVLADTGLGYLKLGQPSPTLSGGEAQRVKLVAHLLSGIREAGVRGGRRAMRPSFFLLEEPTIGLHMADVRLLVNVLQRLVDAGHTVVVIEHNLDLIAEADWVVDLGPEGGGGGGRIIAEGTPEQVARVGESHTGRFLKEMFGG